MSSKHPTHSAYIVIRQDGSEKKAQWFEDRHRLVAQRWQRV